MGAHGGPNITEDGVVFYYDTGNSKSYAGEPTTNILDNDIRAFNADATLGTDSFGDFIQLADATTGYSRFQLPSIPVSSNDIYTWSFELYSTETITTGYSWDTNEYSDQFPNSNDLSRVTFTASTPSTIPAGVWTPFSLTVTMKDGLTGAYTYDFFNFFYPAMQNKKFYYRNMQFEFKDHKTQYAGQGGTRSVTEGLKDFTKNSTIDLTNVSFNSDAQMAFDGTDDRINIGLYHLSASSHTEEVVVYRASTGNAHGILSDLQYGFFGLFINSNDNVVYRTMQSNPGQTPEYPANVRYGTSTLGIGYHHIVGVFSMTEGFRLYVNGELESSSNEILPFNLSGNRGITDIGVYKYSTPTSYNFPFDGHIDVIKAYNRALTAEEVAENFNGIRSRFGI